MLNIRTIDPPGLNGKCEKYERHNLDSGKPGSKRAGAGWREGSRTARNRRAGNGDQIREWFASQGFGLQDWSKIHTDWLTFHKAPIRVSPDDQAALVS